MTKKRRRRNGSEDRRKTNYTTTALKPGIKRIPAPEGVTGDRRWFVVLVNPHKWRVAASELESAGMVAFSPTTARTVIARGKEREYEKPLMPGYMFASHPAGFRSVAGLDGVRGYLSIDGAPAYVPWAALSRIVDYLAAPSDVVAKIPSIGDVVRIMRGALEGHCLVVTGLSGANVVANAFGGKVKIPLENVQFAA